VFSLPEVLGPFIARLPSAELDGRRAATADERQLLRKDDVSKNRLKDTVLFGLAEEIRSGSAEARVNALRRSVLIEPSTHLLVQHEFQEPHRRGEVLVSAVLNAFLDVWVSRIQDPARTDSPLVSRQRVAEEGATIADLLLTIAIRAIDYTPPIHIEFGDYLSAMLTADREIRNDDTRYQLRDRLLTAFASFGILPASGTADGLWKAPPTRLRSGGGHFGSLQTDRTEMFRLVWSNRKVLKLDPQAFTRITSLRPSFRVSPDDGFQIRETVVECTQYLKITAAELSRYGLTKPPGMADEHELTLRGGSTLILDEYGQLKYEIYNRIPSPSPSKQTTTAIARAQQRLDYAWNNGFLDKGASLTQGLAAFHRRRVMGLGMDPRGDDRTARQESWV